MSKDVTSLQFLQRVVGALGKMRGEMEGAIRSSAHDLGMDDDVRKLMQSVTQTHQLGRRLLEVRQLKPEPPA